MSTFVTSIDDIYADSNDRRATMIQLAAGSSLSDLDAASNIDEGSLQILAVFLSNFYTPFLTVLSGNFDEASDEECTNQDYLDYAADALCTLGMNSEAAEFLAEYCLEQSLNTCSQLYVEESILEDVWDALEGSETNAFGWDHILWWEYPGTGRYQVGVGGILQYDDFESYEKYVGTKKTSDGTFVGVTYPVFLKLMSLVTYIDEDNDISDLLGNKYDVSNRSGSNDTNYERRINFYYIDNNYNAHIVFSNDEECLQAFLMVNNDGELMQQGVGTGFFSVGTEEVEAVNNNVAVANASATSWKMYVNWEGSLIVDNAMYRTPVLPGCCNPHMFTSIADSADNASALPLVNFWGVYSAYFRYNSANDAICFDTTKYSFFKLDTWRVELGTTDDCFDTDTGLFAFAGGAMDALEEAAEDADYIIYLNVGIKESLFASFTDFRDAYGDVIIFPTFNTPGSMEESDSFEYLDKSDTYSDDGDTDCRCLPHLDGSDGVALLDDIVYVDTFQGFNSSSTITDFFHYASLTDLSSDYSSSLKENLRSLVESAKNNFASIEVSADSSVITAGTVFLQPLYATYVWAYTNKDYSTYDESVNIVDLKMNVGSFPSYDSSIDWSSLETKNLQLKTLTFVYYLLHPTQGIGYVATLFKNKVGGILLGWHEDVVGSSDSNATTGMTKYLGTSSYVTVPSLYDVEWIANILDMYNSIIVYLIILMSLILLCYVLSGSMTLQRGIIGLACFSLIAFIPPLAINATVNIVNTASDAIYSEKFDYWAICQMELFLQDMDAAATAKQEGDMSSYAAFIISYQSVSSGIGGDSETFYSGVKLKWMAPKKYNSTAQLAKLINSTVDTSTASFAWNLLINSISGVSSGETYLDSDNALYLYRDYTDIYRYASIGYNVLSTFNYSGTLKDTASASNTGLYSSSLKRHLIMYYSSNSVNSIKIGWDSMTTPDTYSTNIKKYVLANTCEGLYGKTGDGDTTDNVYDGSSSLKAIKLGFLFDTCNYSSTSRYYTDIATSSIHTLATSYLMNYCQTISDSANSYKMLQGIADGTKSIDLSKVKDSVLYSASSGYFNLGLSFGTGIEGDGSHNSKDSYLFGISDIIGLRTETSSILTSRAGYSYKQLSDFFYGLYTESPFYYFNFNIRDQLTSAKDNMSSIYSIDYVYNYDKLTNASGDNIGNVAKLFLNNNQYYFYNLTDNSGSGYGELRDFMNMHDLFYYIIPSLRDGVEAARLYDDLFGLYEDEDCSLIFNDTGTFTYDGVNYQSLAGSDYEDDDSDDSSTSTDVTSFSASGVWNTMTDEQKYKFWHSYNTHTILLEYTAWLDAMMDCDYADSETITVMGEKFIVEEPLNPYSYYTCDSNGKMTAGRYMVFSRSEMEYYGLTTADLTTVERKIIELQDNVYEAAIELMNYSTLSDETLIQAYAMLQTFNEKTVAITGQLYGCPFSFAPHALTFAPRWLLVGCPWTTPQRLKTG